MTTKQPTIIYTLTDEAPLLATCAFLPIVRTVAPQIHPAAQPGDPAEQEVGQRKVCCAQRLGTGFGAVGKTKLRHAHLQKGSDHRPGRATEPAFAAFRAWILAAANPTPPPA